MKIMDSIRARRERNHRIEQEQAWLDQAVPTQRSLSHPTGCAGPTLEQMDRWAAEFEDASEKYRAETHDRNEWR